MAYQLNWALVCPKDVVKLSPASMHNRANSHLLMFCYIMGPNLVLTTFHFRLFLLCLLMVGALISTANVLTISVFNSSDVVSSSSSNFFSIEEKIFTVTFVGLPGCNSSVKLHLDFHLSKHFLTVSRVVLRPSCSIMAIISEVEWPTLNKRTISSLW